MGMKAEARKGRDGLWRVFLEDSEVALIAPMPWRHMAGMFATALAEGIDGLTKEEWAEKLRQFALDNGVKA